MRYGCLAILVVLLGAGIAHATDGALIGWFAHYEVAPPTPTHITVCHGFACTYRTPYHVPPDVLAGLVPAMSARNAADERRAIAHVVAAMERRVAPLLDGPPDRARADPSDAQIPGQMDCLDEATNTTAVMLLLEERGLLHFHSVARPEARGFFTFGAHATAVIVENQSHVVWAVDSWVRPSGGLPDVMTLERWEARAFDDGGANAEGEGRLAPPGRR